jgi:hypothetical protein
MKPVFQRAFFLALLSACAIPSVWTSNAAAEADALDTANAKLTEALQALKAAPARGDAAKFEAHRKKAVTLLTRAQGELLKAKRLEQEH